MSIFSGNLDTGFVLGEFWAVISGDGWDVFEAGKDERVAWFTSVVEALRYLKARDDALRSARASQELVRWALIDKKRVR